jgi:pimeloyl-ACP methyl ester carboxylesterase
MQWIEVNGASLRYELSGDGARTLVLVHELGGMLESWDGVLPALTQHYRVLRYDQRGFGLSEKYKGTLTLDLMAEDLAGLLDGLGLAAPCHVAGMALGGGIALGFAARYPQKMARLVVSSPAVGSSDASRPGTLARADAVERDGMRSVCAASLARSYPDILRGDAARFETYRLRWLANATDGFAAINRMLAGMDMAADYAKITCPTLVIAAEHDMLRPPAVIEPIADAIPDARYVETESGHFMAVQTPELFLEHLLPFLGEYHGAD